MVYWPAVDSLPSFPSCELCFVRLWGLLKWRLSSIHDYIHYSLYPNTIHTCILIHVHVCMCTSLSMPTHTHRQVHLEQWHKMPVSKNICSFPLPHSLMGGALSICKSFVLCYVAVAMHQWCVWNFWTQRHLLTWTQKIRVSIWLPSLPLVLF